MDRTIEGQETTNRFVSDNLRQSLTHVAFLTVAAHVRCLAGHACRVDSARLLRRKLLTLPEGGLLDPSVADGRERGAKRVSLHLDVLSHARLAAISHREVDEILGRCLKQCLQSHAVIAGLPSEQIVAAFSTLQAGLAVDRRAVLESLTIQHK